MDVSFLSEFESIALETKQDLHDSFLVSVDHVRVLLTLEAAVNIVLLRVTTDVFKCHMKSILVVQCFSLLDQHDLFNRVDHVELHYIFTELICFYLSVV